MSYLESYKHWLESPALTPEEHAELAALEGQDKEIEDRFFDQLEFGTAGLRGTMGIGLRRMNVYTVGRAAQGLANYVLGAFPEGNRGCDAPGSDRARPKGAGPRRAAVYALAEGRGN